MPSDQANLGLCQVIIGLIGDPRDDIYNRDIQRQMLLTEEMMKNPKAKIPGLEEVPVDRKSSFIKLFLDDELHLEEIPPAQRASQNRKSTDAKVETVVLHICGHHKPKQTESKGSGFGFRTNRQNGFYNTAEITSAFVSFSNQFPDPKDLHVVLHSCKTAKSIATSSDSDKASKASDGSTMQDIISFLQSSQFQENSMNIYLYGVEHKISESRKGYQLLDQDNKPIKKPTFQMISISLPKQKEGELLADSPSSIEGYPTAGDQGCSTSSIVESPTITQLQFTEISK